MIDFSVLKNKVYLENYATCVLTDLIKKEHRQEIAENYPTKHFREFALHHQSGNENISTDITYQFEYFKIENTEEISLREMDFSNIWIELLQTLLSKNYATQLGETVDINLNSAVPVIEFAKYRPGDWLDAHYDRQKHKVLTQIFYFNTNWDTAWGGYFHLLNPNAIKETVISVPPLINYSVIVKPDSRAWHKVEKVSQYAKQSRLNLVLEFYDY